MKTLNHYVHRCDCVYLSGYTLILPLSLHVSKQEMKIEEKEMTEITDKSRGKGDVKMSQNRKGYYWENILN